MSKTKMLTVSAICVAIAIVLDQITLFRMPQGGSVSPGPMLFIALAAYWLGPIYGTLVGVSVGLLDTVIGAAWFVHPIQFLLDYPVALGAIGLAGLFRKMKWGLQIGYVLGCFGRFISVSMASLFFWSEFTPEGYSPLMYALIYNSSYIVPEMIGSLIIISIPAIKNAIDTVTRTSM